MSPGLKCGLRTVILNHKNLNSCLIWRTSVVWLVWIVIKPLSQSGKNTGTCPITFPDRRGPQYLSYSWTDWTSKKRHQTGQCSFFPLLDHVSLFISIIKLLIFTSTPCRTVFVSRLERKMKSLVRAEATKLISEYISMNHYTSVGMLVEKKKGQVKSRY